MDFASDYDALHYAKGPPAVFTRDPKGELRVDPERTREMWKLAPPPDGVATDGGTWVLTDSATGVKMVLVTNHAPFAELQPRADARRVEYAAACAEVEGQWVPVAREVDPPDA
jgi:hypothetical protein